MTTTGPDAADGTDTVDLLDAELLKDPFAGYARIRERDPLSRSELPGIGPVWIATRYDDVRTVLSDPRFVMSVPSVPGTDTQDMVRRILQARGVPPEYMKYMRDGLTDVDGADHARLRRLVSHAFTVRSVARLRPRVEKLAEQLLDRLTEVAEDGVVDLLGHFAYPLPIIVICELVGVPDEDRPRWREWSEALTSGTGPVLAAAVEGMVTSTRELIERRRAEPADDLISGLIRAQDENGDRLGDTEMITMILTLVVAGHETTAHLIANGTAALLAHPDQLALLREDPGLVPGAVHELLRWCGPALMGRIRYAAEDLEIGGRPVRGGEAVMPILAGANHDPDAFGAPERLDVTREPDRRGETHVAFAYGPHYCLGAALARQEGEVAFEALIRRFPGLTLAVDSQDLERVPMPGVWRLATLPVRL